MDKIIIQLKSANYIAIILIWFSFLIGIKFPDWDFKMRLKHRNILTHSPLILWLFIFFYEIQKQKNNVEIFRFTIIGFSMAIGIHMIYDFFPRGWNRGALIHLPITRKSIGIKWSKIFIFSTAIYSIFLSVKYSKSCTDIFVLFTLGIYLLVKSMKREEKFFRPFTIYFISLVLFSSLKYKEIGDIIYKIGVIITKTLNRYLM